ncbi:MAG: hypothetical protein PHF86_03700 [Candidatus Nanoarchaeia archaeon]|nr:hypothetical protein [Candidatus Nanoarchaeia archaeon]
MNYNKIGVLILVFLLVIVNVKAFQLTSTEDSVSLCPRNTQLFIDLVKNDGQQEQTFDVKIAGSSAVWATSIPTGFVLAPGEERIVYTYLTPMSNTLAANYDLDVKVSTTDSSKIAHHTIIVKDCHALKTSADLEKETCAKTKVDYEITVSNLGEFQEIYNLNVEGEIVDSVSLSETNIKLNPGETKKIIAYLESPEETGDYTFSVITKSQSGSVSETKLRLVVNSCYDYNIIADKEFLEFCDQSKENVVLSLTNNGNLINQYDLSVEGALWASLDNKQLILNPKETRKVNLILTPDYSVKGNFEIKVKTLPDKGTSKAQTIIKTNIKDCNSVFVNILGSQDEICNSLTTSYDVVVKNNGLTANTFLAKLDGPKWIKLDDDKSFNLKPEEEKKLKLIISPGFDVKSDDYKVNLKIIAANEPGINYEDSITIKTLSKEDCYKVEVKPQKDSVEVKYDGSATVPINIVNLGKSQSIYELSLSDSAASFTQLNPSIVTINAGDSEVVYAYIAPSAQIKSGDYKALVSAKLKGSNILASGSFNVKVSDSLVVIQKESIFTKVKNYVGGFFVKKVTNETKVEVKSVIIKNETKKPVVIENKTKVEPIVIRNETKPIINVTKVEVKNETKTVVIKNETKVVEPKVTGNVVSGNVLSLDKKVNQLMSKSNSFSLKISNETHTVTLEETTNETVFISIRSNLNYVLLKKGETKSIDSNGDNKLDLKVTFNGFKDGKADVTFEKYTVTKPGFITNTINKIKSFSFWNTLTKYKAIIIIAVVVLVILIIILKTKFHKKAANFFEEEPEQKPEIEQKIN